MVGNAGVGKTSLLAQYIDNSFFDEYVQTIGANFLIKEVNMNKLIDKAQIFDSRFNDVKKKGYKVFWWDVGGQHDKLFANEYYFNAALGACIVFDIVNKESFMELDFWVSKIKNLSGDIPFIVIGNKNDKDNERVVSYELGKKKAQEFGCDYIETSAKLNKNVNEAFEKIALKILIEHVK